jgi:hypothetical protein
MFEPVVVVSAEARYRDLLREAEAERAAKLAGPAEAKRPLRGLATVIAALGLASR